MKEKKCKRCGDLFLAKGKQMYCGKEKLQCVLRVGKNSAISADPQLIRHVLHNVRLSILNNSELLLLQVR